MCGIVGYIGNKKASPILLEGLKRLEYRGYDSAGICTVDNKLICTKKDIGKINEIEKKHDLVEINGSVGLSHCRWATNGPVTKENAHPHTDCKEKISIVHNGIIENYTELKKLLKNNGHKFKSETDTEVIAHLIEDCYEGNLQQAVIAALKKVRGSYALGVICSDEPNILIAARNDSPLVIGVGKDENFIASDVPAVLKYTKHFIFLDNKEVASLTKDDVEIFNLKNEKISKKITEIKWSAEQAEKSGYEHFMLKEIFEQPTVIEETINGRISNGDINLLEEINLKKEDIQNIKRIIFVACGTSWHASIVGEFIIEELAKIPCEVEYASEFRYRDPIIDKDTLVIAISQSGETADTLAAMREAKNKGAKIISICNVVGSSVVRESDGVIYTRAGPEIGVASTKAFTSQLVVIYLLTLLLSKIRKTLDDNSIKERILHLRKIPLQMQTILEKKEEIEKLAKKFFKKTNALYLGRGINYPIALEGALKLKEVSYLHAEGYPAAEMKHGPIALIDKEMPVVCIATKDDKTYEKVLNNIEEVKARHGEVITVATENDQEIKRLADQVLYIPKNIYTLSPILATIPLQLFAYYIAVLRGHDPDKPKNLAKSVTVE